MINRKLKPKAKILNIQLTDGTPFEILHAHYFTMQKKLLFWHLSV